MKQTEAALIQLLNKIITFFFRRQSHHRHGRRSKTRHAVCQTAYKWFAQRFTHIHTPTYLCKSIHFKQQIFSSLVLHIIL